MRKTIINSLVKLISLTLVFVLLTLLLTGCLEGKRQNKVLLISVDGMRPDAISSTEYGKKLMKISSYSLSASTVHPSITLPCHMSMFHSVAPTVHGVNSNEYTPSDNLGMGIAEVLASSEMSTTMFYNWEPLTNLTTPSSYVKQSLINGATVGWEASNTALADSCIEYLGGEEISDFTFLYLGFLDEWGHAYGWLSEEYYYALNESLKLIERVIAALGDEFTVIITTDHGGHDNTHGSEMPEDMTIPVFIIGAEFEGGKVFESPSILDIAPTAIDILGVDAPEYWEGKSLLSRYK